MIQARCVAALACVCLAAACSGAPDTPVGIAAPDASAEDAAAALSDGPLPDVPALDAAVEIPDVQGEISADAFEAPASLCAPCLSADDCAPADVGVAMGCFNDPDVTTGSYCAPLCKGDAECPTGYFCAGHCRPASGACRCSQWAKLRAAVGTCPPGAIVGNCPCHTACLSPGLAPDLDVTLPLLEACNGLDDDCNGVTDDVTCPAKPCQVGTCDSAAQTCYYAPATGAACDDGDACTEQDTCGAAGCAGAVKACDDGNPCTTDSCDPGSGCLAVPLADGTTCSDGCGEASACKGGICLAASGLGLHVYNAPGQPAAMTRALAASSAGYVLAGDGPSSAPNGTSGWFLRADANGKAMSWLTGGPLVAHSIHAAAVWDGGFALGGSGFNGTSVMVFQPDGTLDWEIQSPLAIGGMWHGVILVPGGLVTAGVKKGATWTTDGKTAAAVSRFAMDGTEVWSQTFSGATSVDFSAIAQDGDGFILTGQGPYAPWLMRIDGSGNKVWSKVIYASNSPSPVLRVLALTDGYVMAGVYSGCLSGTCGIGSYTDLLRTDAAGKVLWQSNTWRPGDAWGAAVAPLGSGFVVPVNASLAGIDGAGIARSTWPVAAAPTVMLLAVSTGSRIALAGGTSGVPALLVADRFGNASCAASGACLNTPASACDDGILVTLDRCDVSHGGCWHDGPASVADCPASPCKTATYDPDSGCAQAPVVCAPGKACQNGVCQ